jgi:hypothetical protein
LDRIQKKGVFTNVVYLSKKRCFHGGVTVDNELICGEYIGDNRTAVNQ